MHPQSMLFVGAQPIMLIQRALLVARGPEANVTAPKEPVICYGPFAATVGAEEVGGWLTVPPPLLLSSLV